MWEAANGPAAAIENEQKQNKRLLVVVVVVVFVVGGLVWKYISDQNTINIDYRACKSR